MNRNHSFVLLAALSWAAVSAFVLGASGTVAEAETIRGHTVHRRSHASHGHHGYYSRPYYGYYGYPYAYPYPWYGFYSGYGPAYISVYRSPSVYISRSAIIDTDVRPESAEVYVDGQYVGTADDFDGFPGYLHVEPGPHMIVLKAPGRLTVVREITAKTGQRFDFEMKLPKGEDPAELADYTGARPAADADPDRRSRPPAGSLDVVPETDIGEPGLVRLEITPEDASVYIDGEFYGSTKDLAGLHGDLRLRPGRHTVEVVRPGYDSARREIQLLPGDHFRLAFGLQESPED